MNEDLAQLVWHSPRMHDPGLDLWRKVAWWYLPVILVLGSSNFLPPPVMIYNIPMFNDKGIFSRTSALSPNIVNYHYVVVGVMSFLVMDGINLLYDAWITVFSVSFSNKLNQFCVTKVIAMFVLVLGNLYCPVRGAIVL